MADAVRLEELRLAAAEQRFQAMLDLGRHAEAAPELEAALAEHPLRERLTAQLALALYRSGRQVARAASHRAHDGRGWPKSSASTRRLSS